MKNKLILSLCIMFVVCLFADIQQTCAQSSKKRRSPFGEVYSMPCGDYKDTDQMYVAVGMYMGASSEKGEVHRNAIANAKAIILEKYHQTYSGMISEYSATFSSGGNSDIVKKLERAGDFVIDAVLDDAKEVCTKFSEITDDDKVECYVAIQIKKDELAKKVADKVSDVLTQDEKERVHFDEQQYRERMEKVFGK